MKCKRVAEMKCIMTAGSSYIDHFNETTFFFSEFFREKKKPVEKGHLKCETR